MAKTTESNRSYTIKLMYRISC